MRASFLQRKLLQGRIDPDARACGLEFFDKLKRNGVADAYTFSIFLKHINVAHLEPGSMVSAEMRRVMEEDMLAAGVTPTVPHFNLLVSQLVREGHHDEAKRVVDEEMVAHGLRPDRRDGASAVPAAREGQNQKSRAVGGEEGVGKAQGRRVDHVDLIAIKPFPDKA